MVDKDGKVNYRRYANTLDYSLDQIKLREVYEKVYRRTNFSFYGRKKEYTSRVINVTFKYSVAEFNKAGRNRYIRFGYKDSDLNFNDCVAIKDGELVGIILGQPVERPVPDEILGKYFGFDGGVYTLIKNPRTVKSTAQLRRILYNEGFVCHGKIRLMSVLYDFVLRQYIVIIEIQRPPSIIYVTEGGCCFTNVYKR